MTIAPRTDDRGPWCAETRRGTCSQWRHQTTESKGDRNELNWTEISFLSSVASKNWSELNWTELKCQFSCVAWTVQSERADSSIQFCRFVHALTGTCSQWRHQTAESNVDERRDDDDDDDGDVRLRIKFLADRTDRVVCGQWRARNYNLQRTVDY